MSIPTAICTGCGGTYHGWSLVYRPGQSCAACGSPLRMMPDADLAVRRIVESHSGPLAESNLQGHDPWRESPSIEANRTSWRVSLKRLEHMRRDAERDVVERPPSR
jgi:hypothetical protein